MEKQMIELEEVKQQKEEEKAMIETYFLIPLADNDGKKFKKKQYKEMEYDIVKRFGGLTKAAGINVGYWVNDEGILFEDKTYKYVLAISEDREEELKEVLSKYCKVFKQECLYLNVNGKVYFVD